MTAPNAVVAVDEAELELIREIADRVAQRCADAGSDDHATCWAALRDAGFTDLRRPDVEGAPTASAEVTSLVVERLARRVCGAPLLGHLLATELLRLAGVDADDAPLTVVLDDSWRAVAGDAGAAWDASLATCGVGVRGAGVAMFELAAAESTVDATRPLRPATGGAERGVLSAAAARSFETFARTLLAADMLGCASGIFDDALDYVKERVQFGVAVGSFQAVQHLCAEAYVGLEGLRSALVFAQRAFDASGDTGDAIAYNGSLVAKSFADDAAIGGVETAIQLFGGIAITAEHRAHRHLRRVLLDREAFGDAELLNDLLFDLEDS